MDALLLAALEPVLRDLATTGGPQPRIEESDWTDDPDRPSAMVCSSPGGSLGVSVDRADSSIRRIAEAADKVQEWAIEELWPRAPTNWPRCPRHPDTHPMAATVRDEAAVWICPADGQPVAPIGALLPADLPAPDDRTER